MARQAEQTQRNCLASLSLRSTMPCRLGFHFRQIGQRNLGFLRIRRIQLRSTRKIFASWLRLCERLANWITR
jgi:hypothetical protein